MPKKYVRLTSLLNELARDSGEPPALILRTLASYDTEGMLPPQMLLLESCGLFAGDGDFADLYDRYYYSGYDFIRLDAEKQLKDVLVAIEPLLELCAQCKVRPPRSIASRWRRLRGRHLTFPPLPPAPPPPAPVPQDDPVEVDQVEVHIEWMEEVLNDRKPSSQGYMSRGERFQRVRERAEASLETLIDGPTRRRLAARVLELVRVYEEESTTAAPCATEREPDPEEPAATAEGSATTAPALPATAERVDVGAFEPAAAGIGPDTERLRAVGSDPARDRAEARDPLLRLDRAGRELHFCGRVIPLERRIFLAMQELCEHAGDHRTREKIAARVEDSPHPGDLEVLTKYFSSVRKKLRIVVEEDPEARSRTLDALRRAAQAEGRKFEAEAMSSSDLVKALIASKYRRSGADQTNEANQGAYRLALLPDDVSVG